MAPQARGLSHPELRIPFHPLLPFARHPRRERVGEKGLLLLFVIIFCLRQLTNFIYIHMRKGKLIKETIQLVKNRH